MNIQETLKELQAYIVLRMINGNMTLVDIDAHVAKIEVEGLTFHIWHTVSAEFVRSYEGAPNAVDLTFTEVQQEVMYCLLQNAWKAKERNTLISQRVDIDNRLVELDKEF
jgi:hypothetical protein